MSAVAQKENELGNKTLVISHEGESGPSKVEALKATEWRVTTSYLSRGKDRGDNREHNQDAVSVKKWKGDNGEFAVSMVVLDGVSAVDGEKAAQQAKEQVSKVEGTILTLHERAAQAILDNLNNLAYEANKDIQNERDKQYATAAIAIIRGERNPETNEVTPVIDFANIGDVRIYVLREGKVICLTRDDIKIFRYGVQNLLDTDAIKIQQQIMNESNLSNLPKELQFYAFHPEIHHVSASLGMSTSTPKHENHSFSLQDGDLVLNMVDGAHCVSSDEIAVIWRQSLRDPSTFNVRLLSYIEQRNESFPKNNPGIVNPRITPDDRTLAVALISKVKEQKPSNNGV